MNLDILSLLPIPLGDQTIALGFIAALELGLYALVGVEKQFNENSDWIHDIPNLISTIKFNVGTDILCGHSLGAASVLALLAIYATIQSTVLGMRAVMLGTPNVCSQGLVDKIRHLTPNYVTYITHISCPGIRLNLFDIINPFKGFGFTRNTELYDYIDNVPGNFSQPRDKRVVVTLPPHVMEVQCRRLSLFILGTDNVITSLSRWIHQSTSYSIAMNNTGAVPLLMSGYGHGPAIIPVPPPPVPVPTADINNAYLSDGRLFVRPSSGYVLSFTHRPDYYATRIARDRYP